MRRKTIAVIAGILIVGFGAYTAFWWVAAGKIKLAAGDWAQAAHQKQIDISWQDIHVGGYPFTFRLELSDVVVTDKAMNPPVAVRAPQAWASAWPWNFRTVWFGAPAGLHVSAGADPTPLATGEAGATDGAIAFGSDGRTTVWLDLAQPKIDGAATISARFASVWAIVPDRVPAGHNDAGYAIAALVHDLAAPAAPSELGKTVSELGFGVTMMGALPPGPLKSTLTAWRDSGGTLELNNFALDWGPIGLTGSGTLSLDGDLQPEGSLSGAISGYDQALAALVASGRVKGSDARVARLALSMLGKPGPDGRSQISTNFTIQNGQMQLGPVKLGAAPHIDW